MERTFYDKYWDGVSRELSSLDDALVKGRAEGRIKGELALQTRQVISKKNKGLSISEIADVLEIDIHQVEDILNGQE